MNSRSLLKDPGRDMDFLLVVYASSLQKTAVCSYRFVCNFVLCRLGWHVDRVIITGHCWTRVRKKKHLGLVPCYWVVYSAVGCGSDTGAGRKRWLLLFSSCVHWLKVFWIHDLVSPGLKLRCVRIADKSCDLCCDQQDLVLIMWTNTFAVIVI